MQQPDGKPSSAVAKKEARTVKRAEADAARRERTYVAETAPGSSERQQQAQLPLRAGYVERPNARTSSS
jgi:hypothetical protein